MNFVATQGGQIDGFCN